MTIEVRVPVLPESVAVATLLNWRKRAGETVKRDENLVDIETDKVVLEVPAPEDGILQKILKNDGDTVQAQEVIGVIEPKPQVESPAEAAALTVSPTAAEPVANARSEGAETVANTPVEGAETPAESVGGPLPPSGPAVRRLLSEHSVDPSKVPGTGRGGRITKEDIVTYLAEREDTQRVQQGLSSERPQRAVVKPLQALGIAEPRPEQRVPMTRLRARIAERLVKAQQTAAILTTFNEVDMTSIIALRKRYRESFEKSHGIRLGFMSFFVKASVQALKRFPVINASVDGTDIVYHGYYDIGIAVGSERGLVVPVLRDCDQASLAEIEARIADYGSKVREGALSMEDLTGGTFTITNGGIFGSLMSTPILNPPQSAILGMHKIQDRPVVENGEICIRPMMYLALSYDHRIIDGREAVQFLVTIKEVIEDPTRLLLQV
jgi:2-oxoglutarate dehydrogenase complex dihydrolipoamide succinyltransferase (E2 component)